MHQKFVFEHAYFFSFKKIQKSEITLNQDQLLFLISMKAQVYSFRLMYSIVDALVETA